MSRIISKKHLKDFWENNRDAEKPLKQWMLIMEPFCWNSPDEITRHIANSRAIKDNRIIFKIGGNKYRLIVKVHYYADVVYIKFIGTHEEYDRIDAERVDRY